MSAGTGKLIVGLGGTTRAGSSSESAVRFALAEAKRLGFTTELFDGPSIDLPNYAPERPERTPEALRLIDAIRRADGIVVGSPGYHGSISGMLKNALDYVEDLRPDARPYFDGRPVGCIVTAAGWQAVGTTLTTMRSIVHALRGWPTPIGIGANSAGPKLFDPDGNCLDAALGDQIKLMVRQMADFIGGTAARGAG